MKFNKIATRILTMILPVIILSTVALTLISYYASNSRLHAETQQKMMALLSGEALKVVRQLDKNADVASALVSYSESTRQEDFLSGRYQQFLGSITESNPNTVGAGIWFAPYALREDMQYFGPYYYRSGDAYVMTMMYSGFASDYPSSDWYMGAAGSDGWVVWSHVTRDALSGKIMITASQPFFGADNQLLGVCRADMDLEDIQQVISAIRVGKTGRAFLLTCDGQYLAAADDSSIIPLSTSILDEHDPAAALGPDIIANDRGMGRMVHDGAECSVYYQTIPGVNWKLGLVVDNAEVSAPARSLLWLMLGVAVVTLAATVVAVLVMARRLNGIVDQINGFCQVAAGGDLDARLTLDTGDEFATIADNLNVVMENMNAITRARSDFLSRMSHEIRTPMNAIIGMAQIGRSAGAPEKMQDCLQRIEDNSDHLLGIINDILDFSRMESGKVVLDEKLFSLTANLDFVLSMLQSRVQEKGLTLEVVRGRVDHDGVYSDPLRLNQVLINLLSNAIKFTPEGGRVQLRAEEVSHEAGESVFRFAVEDTGIGIAPEQVQRLFNPFEQASAGISTKYGGTGLGLAISGSIVELMGGAFEVTSVPGEGSTFSFTIRCPAEVLDGPPPVHGADSAAVLSAGADLNGRRALVVDDIAINREIVVELLRETGLAMDTAADGQEAVDRYLAEPPGTYDLVLMDMQMPVLDGCGATQAIRASGRADARSIKIVAMTANVMRDDVRRALDAGMDGHIGKPIDVAELLRVLREMVG